MTNPVFGLEIWAEAEITPAVPTTIVEEEDK
jgi:hypothetical protein